VLFLYGKVLVAKRRYAEGDSMLREAVAALEKNRRGQPRLYARAVAAVNQRSTR
jgi:hypothetical protein